MGSITAALREERALDEDALDHLEDCDDCRSGSAEALAAVIDACDLWSVSEAARASHRDEEIGAAATEAWTGDHERRLTVLVERVRRQLPPPSHPAASAALGRACAEFERNACVRARLAALLLADAVDTLELIDELAA